MGNHIITFAPGVPRNEQREFLGFAAKQTHNGERSEPHNSKLKPTEKEQTYKIYSCVFALSVCNMGLGLAHLRLTSQMRCSHLTAFSNSPLRTPRFDRGIFILRSAAFPITRHIVCGQKTHNACICKNPLHCRVSSSLRLYQDLSGSILSGTKIFSAGKVISFQLF